MGSREKVIVRLNQAGWLIAPKRQIQQVRMCASQSSAARFKAQSTSHRLVQRLWDGPCSGRKLIDLSCLLWGRGSEPKLQRLQDRDYQHSSRSLQLVEIPAATKLILVIEQIVSELDCQLR